MKQFNASGGMRRAVMPRFYAVPLVASFALTSCALTDNAQATDLDAGEVLDEVFRALEEEGRAIYGSVGAYGGDAEGSTYLSSVSEEVEALGVCIAYQGEGSIIINGQEPVALPCSAEGDLQRLHDDVPFDGSEFHVAASGFPEGSAWEVLAVGRDDTAQ